MLLLISERKAWSGEVVICCPAGFGVRLDEVRYTTTGAGLVKYRGLHDTCR
jgi:hypothetical protein